MEGLEEKIFTIISNVGTAKGRYVAALNASKKGDISLANQLIKDGDKFLIEGHKIHSKLVQQEASGEGESISLLLIHAEDQFMSAETVKLLVKELIEVYGKINKLGIS
ncbi:PTS lactose/cellobiose transporter subunit IIA [Sporolactobacillus pectinivorans]|uniref:PTS lactose/cellobiose transporter subunit IIA n=1 Tax=Sporolactobacillus pectinivorans TaxID=1591408 RepID=UPI000C25BA0F|nr:PTS lactose/cellobiose transporter subunit IIA [Sporolactobacillus pectinivorans]